MTAEEEYKQNWIAMCQGDKQALFSLYNSFYFHLLRFGLKTTADDELVKDCVNQIFLNLWDKRAHLHPVDNVRNYLFTTLKHTITDEVRHRSQLDVAVQKKLLDEEWDEMPYEEIIIRLQQDVEVKQKLQLALQKLTPRQMELIQLKFFDGLSYEQIAQRTSQSVKTAYNTIYDAIRVLRRILN
ncbi:RNA polymerase sigma factor [Rufibacter sp. XAAS-G3-1]|uniref:RNA polymerase sigma factor n=1 Tax=Rufibacter sp. XAAS-G3-1 TaxID=2729134 RepID=UPI0015E7067B|nr:sigma-70 family RNA polymerase sigma factor [Rufibacter sp. XAAS-G3-1]